MDVQDSLALTAPAAVAVDTRRESPWVLLFGAFGAATVGYALYGWARWISSSDFKAAPHKPSWAQLGWRAYYLTFMQVSVIAMALWLTWRYVVKPLVRERSLPLEGMMVIGFFFMWFWDYASADYNAFSYSYNSFLWNMGNWTNFIPGFHTPNTNLDGEPFSLPAMYIVWCFGSAVFGRWLFTRFRTRWPGLSNLGMFALAVPILVVGDIVGEWLFIVWPGYWTYAGTIGWLTFSAGTTHQFPFYEGLVMLAPSFMFMSLLYFKDDKGRTFLAKGIDKIRGPKGFKTALITLAVCGWVQGALLSYGLVQNNIDVWADQWAQEPAYMRSGVCGWGTKYACPSKYVPVANKSSVPVPPDDPRLPPAALKMQGMPYEMPASVRARLQTPNNSQNK